MQPQQTNNEEHPRTRGSLVRVLWIAGLPLLAVLGISGFFLPPILLFAEGVLLAGAIAITMFAVAGNVSTSPRENALDAGFQAVLERLDAAVFIYSKDFKIVFWNNAAENLFSVSKDEALGHVLSPQDAESSKTKLLAQVAFPSLAPGMVVRSPAGILPQVADLSFNNPFLEIRVTSFPLGQGADGSSFGFAKIIHDRTREMSLMKSKGEFVTIASHQLRTPTTGIHWALQSLHDDSGKFDSQTKALIDGAFQGSELLLKIIDDLLGIAKIEEGRFGYSFANTDIVEFLDKILSQVLPIAEHAGVSLYFDKPTEAFPPAIADPQKLAMVVSNLIENAIRYNMKNGTVTVGLKRVPNEPFIEITIKDTGIGISSEDVKKLFTKFFRADNALKLQTEGSGLGLYIVRNIIQAHGGKIWVESQLERGTIFHFTLATDQKRVPHHEVPLG
ncbi:MAG: ATP-binding protein [Patescibacteria group bacterium]|nr:ATP-binding protein [Patescibacteria group bacterium]